MPFTSAFAPSKHASFESSSSSTSSSSRRQRKQRTSLASSHRQREDLEDQIWSIRNSWKAETTTTNRNTKADTTNSNTAGTVFQSDVPSDSNNNAVSNLARNFKDRLKLPPAPEDQFIMTGDIAILFLYVFTSHSINDSVVKGLLDNPHMTIPEAVTELDPFHDLVSLQHPVWVDLASNPNVPFGNPALERALEVSARESLMNHWGPLLSTEGSACVALCTCWLIAGWFHRAFMFDTTTYCASDHALTKTLQTWLTSALLLAVCATGTDWLVGHVPALEQLFCVTCKSAAANDVNAIGGASMMGEFKAAMDHANQNQPLLQMHLPMVAFGSLTQSDVLFIVDSLTVLIAWRWSAHRILNTFR